MLRTEIDRNEPLNPGDKIEMEFKCLGPGWLYLRAAELAVLKYTLDKKNPYWELTAWDSTTYSDKLILEFLIKEPPEEQMGQVQQAGIVTPLIIAAIVIGGGLFTWLSLDKIYKITDSPAGKVALAGSGSLGIGILIIAVLLLLNRFRKGRGEK